MSAEPDDNRRSEFTWDLARLDKTERAALLTAFGAAYSVLLWIGLGLHDNAERLTILWPAAGLLFITLWHTRRRNWVWIIAIQVAAELGVGYIMRPSTFSLVGYTPFIVANSVDGIVGAFVASQLIAAPQIPRIQNVVQFIAAVAVGSAASAVLGAFGATRMLGGVSYFHEWQLWWAGNWLGTLSVAPIVNSWAVRWRAREYSAPAAPTLEVLLFGAAVLGLTAWVFSARTGTSSAQFDLQFLLFALVVAAAFRLPPRWSATFAGASALLAAYFASRGFGPFAGDPSPFVRVGVAQLYLASLVTATFMLSVVLVEKRNAFLLLKASEERYRNFIEQSSEAVWRIELSQPMDIGINLSDQALWLRQFGYVAERNSTCELLKEQLGVGLFIDHLQQAAGKKYSLDDLQLTVALAPQPLTFIASLRGVVVAGRLERIWGLARNVTELVVLNERLRQQQERLRSYAQQLVGAEERARRATAVDLHDGIGQQLVGLSMTLQAVAGRLPPELRLLLSEAQHTVKEVQAIAQRVIADLSPPGLYELGLGPALQWLAVYMRTKDNLQVDLSVDVDDAAIGIELRVLVFKIIRELLRNVVRHAGVSRASVTVTRNLQEFRVIVEDQGVGFEWQLSLFEGRGHGFGLWSVADRVRAAAGEIFVETGPGRGCRVSVVFPIENNAAAYRRGAQG
jgi:signal transduction histidine kinase